MPDQDTEITLGIGKLLGMFFGLVALCAIFFVAGYSLGKNTAPANAALLPSAAVSNAAAPRPAAIQVVNTKADCSQTPQGCAAADNDENSALPAANSASVASAGSTRTVESFSTSTAPIAAPLEAARPSANSNPGTYLVQIAAVSKQQDAEALVAALRKKQYQVFIAAPNGDNLFHVQVGPFADMKEAESLRTRLIADGYSPILKK
jgi:DedD protein